MSAHSDFHAFMRDHDVPWPTDLLGASVEVDDLIAYPTGRGSSGAHLVVGRVVGMEPGEDRWGKPVAMLVVRPEARSDRRGKQSGELRPTRVWMHRKTVVIGR